MAPGTLILRADASIAMGTGHAMRCLALAQAWQDEGGRGVFAMAEGTPAIAERLEAEGMDVVTIKASPGSEQDAEQLVGLARERHASWVVVDGYQFKLDYQHALKTAGLKVLVVDDGGEAGAYLADLVLDQNVNASESMYQNRQAYTQLLLGPRYAMLRREFNSWRGLKREIASVSRKVLVTTGGSDPDNITLRIIHAFRLLAGENLEVTVVLGGSNPHSDGIEEQALQSDGVTRLLRNASNMPELMADADLAISAAGTTCGEMCLLGLPAVLIDVAENQTPIARELDRLGIAIHAGNGRNVTPETIVARLRSLLASPERRSVMSARGRKLVDGLGAARVISAMQSANLGLRRVDETDCRLLWEWANEPEVRSASFSSIPIPWEEHQAWFSKKLDDEKVLMLIATDENGSPVGQVRFDRTNGREADIDISIIAERRGSGLGACLIERAVQTAFEETDLVRVHGFVKPGNQASARAFEKADFRNVGTTQLRGNPALHYERDRDERLR